MTQKYTDDQLRQALVDAAADGDVLIDMEGYSTYATGHEITDLRRILSHLPDQQDEWQECTFEEICTGDQIKTRRRGVTSIYDHPVVSTCRSGPLGRRINLERGGLNPDSDTTLYRIPAPVQHPDPAEHPVILVRESVNTKYDKPIPMIWDGGEFYESPKASLHINTITDWTPAKVIADA